MIDLSKLDKDAVAANALEAETRVQELHPAADLRHGPLRDLLVGPHAVLATALQGLVDRYLSARSLLDVTADPTLADDAGVDALLSNFRVTRRTASAASGQVVVVVSSDATAVVAAGAVFYSGDRAYVTPRVFVAKAEAAQVAGAGDRLLTRTADGYAFTVDVVAADAGAASSVRKDAAFLPAAPPAGFLRAYAAGDFDGGADAETNAELTARLAEGVAARGPSSRLNMAAMLRAFTDYRALSVVGYGDPEMLRDRHWVFPVSGGGRCDWYVRTRAAALRTPLTVTAVLAGTAPSGDGVWQFSLGRDDAPGFYEVRKLRRAGVDPSSVAGGYAVTSDERVVDLSGSTFAPDVEILVEGAYSRYQAAVVRFLAPVRGEAVGDSAPFDLEVVGQPLVADVQAYVSSRQNRCYGADCLVRAPVPCFVQASLTVNTTAGGLDPDVAGLRAAVSDAVNSVGFTGRLFASDLVEAARPYLNGGGVSSFDMLGRVRRPDGTTAYVRSPEVLSVPDEPGRCVSHRTVAFYCDPEDVAVTVAASVPSA